MASAAQIAARKTFADLARSGAFKKRKATVKRKTAAKKAVKRNPVAKKTAPVSATIGRKIAKLVEEGYSFKQAEAIAISEYGIHGKLTLIKAAQKHARALLNYPDPLRVTKRGVVRRNPVAKKRARNPSAPGHQAPSRYAVHKALKSGDAGALIGSFPTLAGAKEYAQAYATAHKCAVGIVGKK